jgi:hypothetical protein
MTHTLTATQELGGFPEGKQNVMTVLGETIFDPVPTGRNLERISQRRDGCCGRLGLVTHIVQAWWP